MSVARINALQLVVATLIGAAAVAVGLRTVEGDAARREVQRSAESLANAASYRLNGAVSSLTRAVELSIAQGGIPAGPGAQAAVERWVQARPVYAAVMVASPAGRVTAASQPRLIGIDLSRERWFEAARATTMVVDGAFRGGLSAGEATESVVASPIKDHGGALQGVVIIALGERWFAESTAEMRRSVGGEASLLTVLSSAGAVLYRSGNGLAQQGTGAAVETSARVTGPDAMADWTTVVRAPEPTAGSTDVPWPLVQAALLATLAMGIGGWWLGREADTRLAAIGDPEEGAEPSAQGAGLEALERRVGHLLAREAQASRTARDSRAALVRIRERLHAFEALSGWTYWSIDLAQGHATWSHRASGERASERTMSLEAVTAYVMAEDRALLDLTLRSAIEDDGTHDIELRLSGAGRDGRRLLVRVERATDPGGRGMMLHALTREVGRGESRDGRMAASGDAAVAERRRSSSILRPVVDSVVVDFNDVLTLAISNLDALREQGADRTLVDRTMRGLWRGVGLTERMVSFVRQRIPSLHTASAADVVEGLGPFLAASLPPHVQVAFDIPAGLPPVRCSERQLELVLMNLVLEAQSRAPLGSRIGVVASDVGLRVRIAVEVQGGVGGAPANGTAAGRAEGGLAAAHRLVAEAAGDLIEREEGGVVSFDVLLPAAEREQPRPVPASRPLPSSRILLVHGDMLMRSTLTDAMRDMGHRVEEARSGADALARLSKASFDVLVTEQNLPVMSGLQLAAAAQRIVPGMKIVVTAARGQLPRSAQAFLVLDKPFGRAELAHVLAQPMPSATAVSDAA